MRIKRRAWIRCILVMVALIAAVGWGCLRPVEPSWNGLRLSDWLDAYDSHNRFDEGPAFYSPLSDQEIERALQEMRAAALPVLVEWLIHEPSHLKARLNQVLNQQSWIRFRFQERDFRILAVTGFMAYGAEAQPLLPELLKLSHSRDAHTRMLAYEAAFFTRPDKDVFLPLAARALREEDPRLRAMAAQWIGERFPGEAEEAARKGGH